MFILCLLECQSFQYGQNSIILPAVAYFPELQAAKTSQPRAKAFYTSAANSPFGYYLERNFDELRCWQNPFGILP